MTNSDMGEAIGMEIEASREKLFSLCEALVASDSTNPPGTTAGVAKTVSAWLTQEGVPLEVIKSDDSAPNIVCPVVGAKSGRHVVFNAHMDTMEAGEEALWTDPPLKFVRREGRAYGLGMGNMKGALAAMCLATALIHRRRESLAGRLSLTAVSDEVMFGNRGTVFLLEQRPDLKGDFLISGEGPGYMHLAIAEKGLLWLDVEARGDGGHSSGARTGATATIALASFLAAVDRLNDMYAEVPSEVAGISGGEGNLGLRLSVNTGTLAAGTVRSQIATRATAQLDLRLPPGISADKAQKLVADCIPPGADITLTRVKAWDANWTGIESEIARTVSGATHVVVGRRPHSVVRLPGSDARRWRELGVPAVCYGPQPTLSAGIDDYANEQDVVDCAKVYALAALALMQPQR
jgi:succinyl-diaminopimelate desuccinylase